MPRETVIAVVACLCAAACGGQARSTATTGSGSSSTATTTTSSPRTTAGTVAAPRQSAPVGPRRRVARVDHCPPRSSGALPQTDRMPSAKTPCFRAVVRALWRAVREDSPRAALYAFFPVRAYEQVKSIGDPYDDYKGRLIPDYALDLHAAHELLGADAAEARLVRAIVPEDVHWVPPGACDNRLGYYEVANSRLVYRIGEQVRSFGIASLISWRGTWYVVHLGAVTRSGYAGVVDDPSEGPGTPAPSLTC